MPTEQWQPVGFDWTQIVSYEVDVLAVGDESRSGDAIALRYGNYIASPGSQTVVVIDGGFQDSGEQLVEHIKRWYRADRVDFVFSTHPDMDHVSGLKVVLEKMTVGVLLMHRPWQHTSRIQDMFQDGRITNHSLKERFRRSLEDAFELEQIALRKGVRIEEPFAGVQTQDGVLTVLGPSEEYYLSLLPDFEKSASQILPERGMFERAWAGAQAVLRRIREDWDDEKLVEPDPDAVSPRNNSSVILLAQLGNTFLFTGDAGVPALTLAADYSDENGYNLRSGNYVQVPHHGSKRNVGPRILNRIIGPPLPEGSPPTKASIVSAAKKGEPVHPSKPVTNAVWRRGAAPNATQGTPHCYWSPDASRANWEPIEPIPFATDYDEEED